MGNYKQTIGDITGYLGLGSMVILGVFLILDGRMDILRLIENYSSTSTWSAVVAIPILVIAYLLGIIVVTVADIIFDSKFEDIFSQTKLFTLVAISENETLIEKYVELERVRRLMVGSTLPFIILGLGSLSEISNIPDGRQLVCYVGLLLGICAAISCPYIAKRVYKKNVELVKNYCDSVANNSSMLSKIS